MLHAALMTPTDVVIQLVAACEVFRAVFASIDEGSAEVNVFDMLPHIATIRANPSAYCTSVTSGAILQSTRVRHWRRAREHRSVAHKLGGILAAWGGDGDGGGGGGGEGGGQLRGGGRDSAGRVWHRGVQQAALAAQPPISATHLNFALDFAYLRGGNIFQNRNQARPQSGRAIWKN